MSLPNSGARDVVVPLTEMNPSVRDLQVCTRGGQLSQFDSKHPGPMCRRLKVTVRLDGIDHECIVYLDFEEARSMERRTGSELPVYIVPVEGGLMLDSVRLDRGRGRWLKLETAA